MFKRSLTTAAVLAVALTWSWGAAADDRFGQKPFTDLYAFGDSLTDTGNIFALTNNFEPPSPPYFDGRYSSGPVWIETLAPLLGLEVDFETTVLEDPLTNNQAVGGAFTDFRNAFGSNLFGTGILGQVARFAAAGGRIARKDLVVVWGGANNYAFDPFADPDQVVADLVEAVEQLADLGGRRFLLPNLPDLGRTPYGKEPLFGTSEELSAKSRAHNAALAAAAAELRDDDDLAVLVLDVESGFDTLLDAGTVFVEVEEPCLDDFRQDNRVCPELGDTFDAGALGGKLFWDTFHPSSKAHAMIAFLAQGTLTGGVDSEDDDD